MKCSATLRLGDDYGDNTSTFRCQLEEGHQGPHQEVFKHTGVSGKEGKVVVTWEEDEGEEFYFKDRFFSDELKRTCKRLDGLTTEEQDTAAMRLFEDEEFTKEEIAKCASCELFSRCQDRIEPEKVEDGL
ncbi:MAG: hypothetical protein WC444_04810 [Candidatus Paceibacterota bacterium]